MAFSTEKRIRVSHSPVVLRNRLIPLKQRLVSGDNSVKAEIASLELDLKLLISAELEGSKIRSRSRWFERAEKPTRLFLQPEKERSSRGFISSFLDSDDVEVFTRQEIERLLSVSLSPLIWSLIPLLLVPCYILGAQVGSYLSF